jgi:cytochrome d ubiquinol oxidase subunit II
MAHWLPLAFALVAVFAIAAYVCLDGMDLGVGILYLFAPRDADRQLMMESIEPIWDGNETWLVLGAMVLLVGFPNALAVILPALYLPLVLMLLCLVLRGVAFEFRGPAHRSRFAWDLIFAASSLIAAGCQGLILGTYVSGAITPVGTPTFAFISWFSLLTAGGLIAGYALLGATWVFWRTQDSTRTFAREIARPALLCVGVFIAAVSIWTPISQPSIAQRWFSHSNLVYLIWIPLLTATAWLAIWRELKGRRDIIPFVLSIAIFVLCLLGLCFSVYPFALPQYMTIWQAASRPDTLMVAGTGLAICLPVVIGYLAFSYWIFRGKVTAGPPDSGY